MAQCSAAAGGFDYYHSPLRRRLLEAAQPPYYPRFFKTGNIFDASYKLDNGPVLCELPCTAACDRDMVKIKWLK